MTYQIIIEVDDFEAAETLVKALHEISAVPKMNIWSIEVGD